MNHSRAREPDQDELLASILAAAHTETENPQVVTETPSTPGAWRVEARRGTASLKLRIEVDGEEYSLDLQRNGATSEYRLGVRASPSRRAGHPKLIGNRVHR